jgi:glucose-6-phosphate dehydrogenase assembly protein OpcA
MGQAAPAFATGLPVELGSIERELKKLWAEGGERMTRASLVNLAVYSERPGSLEANTQIVAQLTEDHACRAIVIAADPSAQDNQVQAWIAAHCHVSRAGSKQVCSEQISFSLTGSFARLLPNIVFSHLDSDLPFYLWWQEALPREIDPQLWSWVDRLIYDSQTWSGFEQQIAQIEKIQAEANQRIVLCDLNWTRLVQLRLAIAQFFDYPASHEKLAELRRVEVQFAAGYRSTAVLLIGWLAAQLGWMFNEATDDAALVFASCSGEPISVALTEIDGEPLSRCSLFSDAAEFRVTHAPEADLLEACALCDGAERMHQLLPAGLNEPVALMSEELMRGGPHRVYLRALQAVRELL